MIYKYHKTFKLSLVAMLAVANPAAAASSYFATMDGVNAFCAKPEVSCTVVFARATKGYDVVWEEYKDGTSGPRRGKGGDGDGDEFDENGDSMN